MKLKEKKEGAVKIPKPVEWWQKVQVQQQVCRYLWKHLSTPLVFCELQQLATLITAHILHPIVQKTFQALWHKTDILLLQFYVSILTYFLCIFVTETGSGSLRSHSRQRNWAAHISSELVTLWSLLKWLVIMFILLNTDHDWSIEEAVFDLLTLEFNELFTA